MDTAKMALLADPEQTMQRLLSLNRAGRIKQPWDSRVADKLYSTHITRGMTHKQLDLAATILLRHDPDMQGDAPKPQRIPRLHELLRFFDYALTKTTRPALRFPRIPGMVGGIAITSAGRLKHGDTRLWVRSLEYPLEIRGRLHRVTYAAIDQYAQVIPQRACPQPAIDFIATLSADFRATVAREGHEHGRCCLCWRPIQHEPSLSTGYGRACAIKWGLPHPDISETKNQEQPQWPI